MRPPPLWSRRDDAQRDGSLGIIRFEIVCTLARRTYRLHGVRIILRDRDPGVAQDLDWGRHTPRLACHHFNYIHPAQCPSHRACPTYPVALIKLLAGYFPCNAASPKRSSPGIRIRSRRATPYPWPRLYRANTKINKGGPGKEFLIRTLQTFPPAPPVIPTARNICEFNSSTAKNAR